MTPASAKPPKRVMIVEDSTVVRTLLTHIIGRDPRLAVAAVAPSAEEAMAMLPQVAPDVISMDIRLPGLDGLEATRRIMSEHPTPIVVIADAVEDSTLKISMNALRAGALTVVEKPTGLASADYERVAGEICNQLFIMSGVPVIRRRAIGSRPPLRPFRPDAGTPAFDGMDVLGLAASTGGPPALARVMAALPVDLAAPVFIVQHMGAPFMQGFADWLAGLSPIPVRIGRHGEKAEPGHAYVAPGDRHMTLDARGVIALHNSPPVGGQRPAATVLFQSLAQAAGPRAVGVLMTGMGEDGAQGLLEMRQAGGFTITEDASSAVVYGMPAAGVRLGASRVSLPLDLIGPRLAGIARGTLE